MPTSFSSSPIAATAASGMPSSAQRRVRTRVRLVDAGGGDLEVARVGEHAAHVLRQRVAQRGERGAGGCRRRRRPRRTPRGPAGRRDAHELERRRRARGQRRVDRAAARRSSSASSTTPGPPRRGAPAVRRVPADLDAGVARPAPDRLGGVAGPRRLGQHAERPVARAGTSPLPCSRSPGRRARARRAPDRSAYGDCGPRPGARAARRRPRAPDRRPVRGRDAGAPGRAACRRRRGPARAAVLLVCFCMVRSHMARLKIAYIGGGSTRGAGTMASFIEQGENFTGSEIVLIDLDADRLELIRVARRSGWRAPRASTSRSRATTDRRAGLDACDAVLTSYRPGGFEARVLDERIPLDPRRDRPGDAGPGRLLHGAALDPRHAGHPRGHRGRLPRRAHLQLHEPGQHRRPGGHATTPTSRSSRSARARSSSPRSWPRPRGSTRRGSTSRASGSTTAPGACATRYDGRGPAAAAAGGLRAPRATIPALRPQTRRMLRLATVMDALPSEYFQYYYFEDEVLGELTGQADHARRGHPLVGPGLLGALHRAGRRSTRPSSTRPLARRHPRARAGDRLHGRGVQRPRRDAAGQRAQPGLRARASPDTLVVETLGRCDAQGVTPAADAGPAGAPARPGRGARRVPAGGGRRGVVGRRARRRCARSPRTRSCARSTWPSGSTGRWPRRTARTCPARLVPA